MSTVPQIRLPPELVHAILIQMRDRDEHRYPIKRGLASCSLTCRYWAPSIRPLLFEMLTLRSGEDVSQLVAFLDADSLQPALNSCIHYLCMVEDQALAESSWSHQLIRLTRRLPEACILHWAVKGSSAASDSQHLLVRNRMSPLPFAALPRTLPPSILGRVFRLTLSGLSLRSLRDLARFLGNQMSCYGIELENVTFAEESVEEVQLHRAPAFRSVLDSIRVSHGLLGRDAILYWMKTSRTLFSSQGHERLDNNILELVESYLHLLISRTGRQDQIQHFLLWKAQRESGMYFHPLSE